LKGPFPRDGASLAGVLALVFLFVRSTDFGADAATIPSLAAFGVGAFAFVRQFGRHKADRDSLEHAERRYRTLVEQLPIATYVLRVFDAKVVYVAR
jgi:PAS domain-containing protein